MRGSLPPRNGTTPAVVSLSPRGFHNEDAVGGEGNGDAGRKLEFYEEVEDEMDGVGWNQFWRRGDVVAPAWGSGGVEGARGSGELDRGSRELARKVNVQSQNQQSQLSLPTEARSVGNRRPHLSTGLVNMYRY